MLTAQQYAGIVNSITATTAPAPMTGFYPAPGYGDAKKGIPGNYGIATTGSYGTPPTAPAPARPMMMHEPKDPSNPFDLL